jgi:hypothetical protein
VCNFQNAHAFAFISNNFGVGPPSLSQGYLALVIPNTSIVPRNPAGSGKERVCRSRTQVIDKRPQAKRRGTRARGASSFFLRTHAKINPSSFGMRGESIQ